jgi:hypothetical protein
MFSKQCKLHLEEVGKSGPAHMAFALKTAVRLQLLVPALVIHAVAPRFFTHTASDTLKDILNEST